MSTQIDYSMEYLTQVNLETITYAVCTADGVFNSGVMIPNARWWDNRKGFIERDGDIRRIYSQVDVYQNEINMLAPPSNTIQPKRGDQITRSNGVPYIVEKVDWDDARLMVCRLEVYTCKNIT